MNNEKAKFILRSYRLSGADASDPVFRQALEQASRDPELGAWLSAERAQDAAITASLRSVPVPESLHSDLLAVGSLSRRRSFWRRSRSVLALAATLVILLGALGLFLRGPQPALSLHHFPEVATRYLSRPFLLDHTVVNVEEMQNWVADSTPLASVRLPRGLQALVDNGVGCRRFSWRGQSVALLCFTLEDGRPAHFFVMDARHLPEASTLDTPLYAQQHPWVTATWVEGEQAFVLATQGSIADARAIL